MRALQSFNARLPLLKMARRATLRVAGLRNSNRYLLLPKSQDDK